LIICSLSIKTRGPGNNLPSRIDYPITELNPCCFVKYVLYYQTAS
jgi:hypothetical protein